MIPSTTTTCRSSVFGCPACYANGMLDSLAEAYRDDGQRRRPHSSALIERVQRALRGAGMTAEESTDQRTVSAALNGVRLKCLKQGGG